MSDDGQKRDDDQRLIDAYTEMAKLAGGLAHEIKNPLSTIRLNMELMAEDFRDSQTPRDKRTLAKLDVMQRECQRLQNVLDDFLNFTKPRRLNLQPTDLNAEITRLLDFYAPKAAEARIEIYRYLDLDLASVVIDRDAFQSVLMNLLLNAQQAMPGGGQLVVRTRPLAQGVALDLIDTGVGMDSQTQSQIFQTFYSTKPGGSGLGLPTARKIIEAHGGRIFVQSEPGRGTQFTIALPTPPRINAESNGESPAELDESAELTVPAEIVLDESIYSPGPDAEIVGDASGPALGPTVGTSFGATFGAGDHRRK